MAKGKAKPVKIIKVRENEPLPIEDLEIGQAAVITDGRRTGEITSSWKTLRRKEA